MNGPEVTISVSVLPSPAARFSPEIEGGSQGREVRTGQATGPDNRATVQSREGTLAIHI